ncbi:MAG: NADPH-dependent F420 reductase [Dehalococcoidia bacterium]|nr:NADPH-dependent F420 reductase [Dehalococcoidia bacterium]
MRIAFIGGTGDEGMGLAYRLARAGHVCIIGSRSLERAQAAADALRARDDTLHFEAATNVDAARDGELTVVTTPYAALAGTLPPLADVLARKIAVSTVVPMGFSEGRASLLAVPEGSAAQQQQALLPDARIVGAFQNLSAKKLLGERAVDADVVVCADDDEAKQRVMALAGEIEGVRGIDGGALASSQLVEAITVLLVSVNRNYKARAGVRITGLKL